MVDRLSRLMKKRKYNFLSKFFLVLAIIAFLYWGYTIVYPRLFSSEATKTTRSTEFSQLISSEASTVQTYGEDEEKRLSEQLAHHNITHPMSDDRLDEGTDPTILGKILSPDIGLDLEYWQGTGFATGDEWSEDEQSDDQRLLKATSMKKDQQLGTDNFVLAAHSLFDASPDDYFNPLLKGEDGQLIESPLVTQLKVKSGTVIYVFHYATNLYYKFKVSTVFIDHGENNYQKTLDAQGDIANRPQLTLYVCADRAGSQRLVVQAELVTQSTEP